MRKSLYEKTSLKKGRRARRRRSQPHLFDIFFQAPVVLGHGLGRFNADIAEMPAFGDEACQLLLIRREADDEAIFCAMFMQPFLLCRSGEAHIRHGDVKRQPSLMLACSGGRDGVIGGRQTAVARPVRVVF